MDNIKNIVKIKEIFPNISVKKIKKVQKMLNKPKKDKPRLNIITKDLLRKQIIILMSLGNSNKFMVLSNKHVSNINKAFKDIKSDILANFIQADNKGLTITTNKVISTSDLSIIEKYIKNINVVDSNNVLSLRLS